MKKIKILCGLLFLLVAATNCTKIQGVDQDLSFLSKVSSSNLAKIFDISTDNSGTVKITPTGDGVVSYKVDFGHGTGTDASATFLPGGTVTHVYPEGSYTVTITAYDIAGVSTVSTYPLVVTYRAPEDVSLGISPDVVVNATANYAKSFLVYYGDVANEVGTPLAIGASLPAHTYPAGGPYTMKLVALSGGAATTTVEKTLFGVPVDFESSTVNYAFTTTGTGQLWNIVTNPDPTGINTSAKVGKYTKGTEGSSSTAFALDIPMYMSQGKKVKIWAYNPDVAMIGKKVVCELGNAVGGKPGNGIAVAKVAFTQANAWEELTFDFSTISTVVATTKFQQILFRFNTTSAVGGAIIYIDNIRITN